MVWDVFQYMDILAISSYYYIIFEFWVYLSCLFLTFPITSTFWVLFFPALAFVAWKRCVSRWQTCFQGYGGCSQCCQNTAASSCLLATTGRTSGTCLTRTRTSSRLFRNTNRKDCTPQRHCEVETLLMIDDYAGWMQRETVKPRTPAHQVVVLTFFSPITVITLHVNIGLIWNFFAIGQYKEVHFLKSERKTTCFFLTCLEIKIWKVCHLVFVMLSVH